MAVVVEFNQFSLPFLAFQNRDPRIGDVVIAHEVLLVPQRVQESLDKNPVANYDRALSSTPPNNFFPSFLHAPQEILDRFPPAGVVVEIGVVVFHILPPIFLGNCDLTEFRGNLRSEVKSFADNFSRLRRS